MIRPLPARSRGPRARAVDETARPPGAGPEPPGPSWFRPWVAFKRLTTFGFPRRFPIIQFPNVPLIAAFLAGEAGKFAHGSEHRLAASAAYLAMTIWAYEELAHGVNWFRHLLGAVYVIVLVIRVSHGLQG